MVEISIAVNPSLIEKYDPLLKFRGKTEDGIIGNINIPEHDLSRFIEAYATLMKNYKIPSVHHGSIIYILQLVNSKAELLLNSIEDFDTQAVEILDFFIKHLKINPAETSDKSNTTILRPYKSKSIKTPFTPQFIVNSIATTLKGQTANIFISNLFKKFDGIPPIEELKEAKKELEFFTYAPITIPILETVEQLDDYIVNNLGEEVSRKKQVFIYDLLYLMDYLTYLKSQDGKDYRLLKRVDYNGRRRPEEDKILFIKRIRAAYKKRLSNL